MKHRTQILLDPEQYHLLKSLSRREGLSLGAILRRFIDEKNYALMSRHKDPLAKLIGSFRDSECTSENYEEFLYGRRSH